jgi:hypothetical protein
MNKKLKSGLKDMLRDFFIKKIELLSINIQNIHITIYNIINVLSIKSQ